MSPVLQWFEVVEEITPYVVKIQTSQGTGTGFVFHYYKGLAGIATAYHVIEHADLWHEPLRISQNSKTDTLGANESERTIRKIDDTAVIWKRMSHSTLEWPKKLIPLLPGKRWLKIGADIGWLGYPWGGWERLHFFSGTVSDFNPKLSSYFIDGTAINGVSGGPVLCIHPNSNTGFYIIGSISAYIANRATGETLPGLSVAQDVSQLHKLTPSTSDD